MAHGLGAVKEMYLEPFARRFTAAGFLVRRPVMGSSEVSVYYLHYRRGAALFTSASGDERREIVDVRLKGAANGFDWDIEAMNQTGRIGSQAIDGVWGSQPARRSARDL